MASVIQRTLFRFYYLYSKLLNRVLPSISLDGRRLRIFPGVYKPLDAEHRLADFIQADKTVLDVGCGSGVLSVFMAPKSKHVTALDISPQALENTRFNCREHGLENLTVLESDMYSAAVGTFDYIVSYPPLFKMAFASRDQQWCTSLTFVEELFRGAAEHLSPGGKLIVLLPAAFDPSPIELANKNGLKHESSTLHNKRSLSTRLHSIPYLHFNMNNHVFIFSAASDS